MRIKKFDLERKRTEKLKVTYRLIDKRSQVQISFLEFLVEHGPLDSRDSDICGIEKVRSDATDPVRSLRAIVSTSYLVRLISKNSTLLVLEHPRGNERYSYVLRPLSHCNARNINRVLD